jgi:hypothetical protein
MGIEEVVTAPRSPWQNPYVERVIGSIRREFLDHVIILNERHLRRVLSFNIIMTPERISRSTRTAHGPVACNFPPRAKLLPSPRSAVCIIAMSVASNVPCERQGECWFGLRRASRPWNFQRIAAREPSGYTNDLRFSRYRTLAGRQPQRLTNVVEFDPRLARNIRAGRPCPFPLRCVARSLSRRRIRPDLGLTGTST